MNSNLVRSSFYPLNDTFDTVALPVAFVPEFVPTAVKRGLQPVDRIDEKGGVIDVVFLV